MAVCLLTIVAVDLSRKIFSNEFVFVADVIQVVFAMVLTAQRHGLQSSVNADVVRLVSHATQERLRTVLEKLSVISEHRQETFKVSVSDVSYL